MTTGKYRRLHRLIPASGGALWLPIDDGLIVGPINGLEDLAPLLTPPITRAINAVLCFRGPAERMRDCLLECAVVENLTASTRNIRHTDKRLVASVESALQRGADGVAYHLNVTDETEPESFQRLGAVADECSVLGLPLCVVAYPRKADHQQDPNYEELKRTDPIKYSRLVAHSVRIAVELGADVVKTQYTGSPDTFSRVVAGSLGVPILIAGGWPMEEFSNSDLTRQALRAGAAGVCFGRRIFSSRTPEEEVRQLRQILDHGGMR